MLVTTFDYLCKCVYIHDFYTHKGSWKFIPSTPSINQPGNSGVRISFLDVDHWTPEGYCRYGKGLGTVRARLAWPSANLIHFNFIKEIRLKINDTQKSNSINPLQFYKRNPFKNESHQKKSSPKNWNRLQFYIRNPFKIYSEQKKN